MEGVSAHMSWRQSIPCAFLGLLCAMTGGSAQAAGADWEVAPGFALDGVATGFDLPTALAFVPDPGPEPNAPLFFVAQLRGTLEVVTRSGEVFAFADRFGSIDDQTSSADRPLAEMGTAGLCLAPEQGHVFVTYVFRDPDGVLRNALVRFHAEPRRFSLREQGHLDLSGLFSGEESAESHQIGPCQVVGDRLWVSVGDGFQIHRSHARNSFLGKILRMDFEGQPVPENPFYDPRGTRKRHSYLFATGLRNAFGLRIVDGRVFIAENGPRVDRFVELEAGEDSLWDGSDWSLSTNASVVFAPSVSPVQLDFLAADDPLFPPEYRGQFYVATAGSLSEPGPGLVGDKGVLRLDYDFATRRMRRPPEPILRYRGAGVQAVVGLAFGPDGLYVAPLMPDEDGRTQILRLRYAPEAEHPFVIGRSQDATAILQRAACLGCHSLRGRGGAMAPTLDRADLVQRNLERLASPDYLAQLEAVDTLDREPQRSHRAARAALRDSEGMERLRIWLRNRLIEPAFDDPAASMPAPHLAPAEVDTLVTYLLGDADPQPNAVVDPAAEHAPSDLPLAATALLLAFVCGFAAAVLWRARR